MILQVSATFRSTSSVISTFDLSWLIFVGRPHSFTNSSNAFIPPSAVMKKPLPAIGNGLRFILCVAAAALFVLLSASTRIVRVDILTFFVFSAFYRKTSGCDRFAGLSVKQQNICSRNIHTCLLADPEGNTSEDHACQQVLSDPVCRICCVPYQSQKEDLAIQAQSSFRFIPYKKRISDMFCRSFPQLQKKF